MGCGRTALKAGTWFRLQRLDWDCSLDWAEGWLTIKHGWRDGHTTA